MCSVELKLNVMRLSLAEHITLEPIEPIGRAVGALGQRDAAEKRDAHVLKPLRRVSIGERTMRVCNLYSMHSVMASAQGRRPLSQGRHPAVACWGVARRVLRQQPSMFMSWCGHSKTWRART